MYLAHPWRRVLSHPTEAAATHSPTFVPLATAAVALDTGEWWLSFSICISLWTYTNTARSSGSNDSFCGQGCQSGFGTCTSTPPPPPPSEGSCGGVAGKSCMAGNCCSKYGFWSVLYLHNFFSSCKDSPFTSTFLMCYGETVATHPTTAAWAANRSSELVLSAPRHPTGVVVGQTDIFASRGIVVANMDIGMTSIIEVNLLD